MTRDELRRLLEEQAIRTDAYALSGASIDEAYVLSVEGAEWMVYYSERGLKSGLRRFKEESEACDYIYELISGDPTTKPSA